VSARGYQLLGRDGVVHDSSTPGLLGGNRRLKIYGRLDCPSARRALARGYAKRRVFFADETTAISAGYRPCGVCMRPSIGDGRSLFANEHERRC
jgi:hypothetical protein